MRVQREALCEYQWAQEQARGWRLARSSQASRGCADAAAALAAVRAPQERSAEKHDMGRRISKRFTYYRRSSSTRGEANSRYLVRGTGFENAVDVRDDSRVGRFIAALHVEKHAIVAFDPFQHVDTSGRRPNAAHYGLSGENNEVVVNLYIADWARTPLQMCEAVGSGYDLKDALTRVGRDQIGSRIVRHTSRFESDMRSGRRHLGRESVLVREETAHIHLDARRQ